MSEISYSAAQMTKWRTGSLHGGHSDLVLPTQSWQCQAHENRIPGSPSSGSSFPSLLIPMTFCSHVYASCPFQSSPIPKHMILQCCWTFGEGLESCSSPGDFIHLLSSYTHLKTPLNITPVRSLYLFPKYTVLPQQPENISMIALILWFCNPLFSHLSCSLDH
jgi:hypothetical protein